MFVPMDITIGAYGSIFNHFQTSNQKSVLKNKWLSSFQVAFKKEKEKKKKKNPDLPTLKKALANSLRSGNRFLMNCVTLVNLKTNQGNNFQIDKCNTIH
jgi:hypothetical protein